jgi:Cytochrome P460
MLALQWPEMQRVTGTLQPVALGSHPNRRILPRMFTKLSALLLGGILLISFLAFRQEPMPGANAPAYTADGQMKFPEHYREWVYLTTGIDMSYNPALASMDHSMFDNVFVNPEAYKAFKETGTWPDKTVLVLEARGAQSKGSINQKGHYQGSEVMGVEVHVKDEARFPGKWAFFPFDNEKTAKMIPTNMDCYSCHSSHGAVDTTFVQFYPTLLDIAKQKGTLSSAYQKEAAAHANK